MIRVVVWWKHVGTMFPYIFGVGKRSRTFL